MRFMLKLYYFVSFRTQTAHNILNMYRIKAKEYCFAVTSFESNAHVCYMLSSSSFSTLLRIFLLHKNVLEEAQIYVFASV